MQNTETYIGKKANILKQKLINSTINCPLINRYNDKKEQQQENNQELTFCDQCCDSRFGALQYGQH